MAQDPKTQPGGYFLEVVSAQTGIDPRVLFAWMNQEGAFRQGGTGGYNYLNMQPFAGDKHISISGGGFAQFANVQDAAAATVTLLHSPQYKNILNTAKLKPSPRQQIAAIAASPWDANHYDTKTPGSPAAGGPKLLDTFTSTFTKEGGSSAYLPPSRANTIETGSAEQSLWADMNTIADVFNAPFTSGSGLNPADDIVHAGKVVFGDITSVGDAIHWVFNHWERVFLVLGGAIGLLLAILLLYKSQSGEKTFTFSRGE